MAVATIMLSLAFTEYVKSIDILKSGCKRNNTETLEAMDLGMRKLWTYIVGEHRKCSWNSVIQYGILTTNRKGTHREKLEFQRCPSR